MLTVVGNTVRLVANEPGERLPSFSPFEGGIWSLTANEALKARAIIPSSRPM
jgi:hypothetical protein